MKIALINRDGIKKEFDVDDSVMNAAFVRLNNEVFKTATESISIASLRSRICEARSTIETIGGDARSLWEAAPANSFTCNEAGNMHDELENVAAALGELEGPDDEEEEG